MYCYYPWFDVKLLCWKHTNKTLCIPGPRRKEQWHHKRLTQTCLWVFRSLWRKHGLVVACCRLGALSVAVHAWDLFFLISCMGPFEGGHHCIHYLHHSLASGQITEREHSPTHQQKIGLKIYWAWSCPSEQDQISSSVSLAHQEASISLLCFSIRGQSEWKPQSEN